MIRPLVSLFLASLAANSALAGLAKQAVIGGDGAVHIYDSWGYDDCGNTDDIIQIDSIVVTPDPPKPGEDLTVEVKGTVLERIEEGAYADVTVKLGLITLIKKEFDLCEEANNNASISCPVEEGDYTVTQTVALPKEIPQAKFTVDVKAYSEDDDDLCCLKLKIDFMKGRGIFDWL